jgi:predicted negative regulator of RcsB-dependent stress response
MEPTTTSAAAVTVSPVSVFVGGVALGAGVYTGWRLAQTIEDKGADLANAAYQKTRGLFKKKDTVNDSEQARAARAARAFDAVSS